MRVSKELKRKIIVVIIGLVIIALGYILRLIGDNDNGVAIGIVGCIYLMSVSAAFTINYIGAK